MFQELTNLFTLGDLDNTRKALLNTSSWKQHEFTAHGHAQIEKSWLNSIELFGFSKVIESQAIDNDNLSALYLKLSNSDDKLMSLSLIYEHNKQFIKRVSCIIDSKSLAKFSKISEHELLTRLPTPDPLFISQFDHQLHPESFHALPNDIATLPEGINDAVQSWWHIWQENQLSSFNDIYLATAKISIAGYDEPQTIEQLRNYKLKLNNIISRSYCQLEHIAVDQKGASIAVSWQIDGDFIDGGKTKRIRIPVQSFLTIENNKIIDEKLMIDWLALKKRFSLTKDIL
jgi:hypothetical protein